MIALALSCDGMDSSRRWLESHQSFLCLSTLISLVSERYFWLYNYETVNSFIAK
jgi:hypothetical protein